MSIDPFTLDNLIPIIENLETGKLGTPVWFTKMPSCAHFVAKRNGTPNKYGHRPRHLGDIKWEIEEINRPKGRVPHFAFVVSGITYATPLPLAQVYSRIKNTINALTHE